MKDKLTWNNSAKDMTDGIPATPEVNKYFTLKKDWQLVLDKVFYEFATSHWLVKFALRFNTVKVAFDYMKLRLYVNAPIDTPDVLKPGFCDNIIAVGLEVGDEK
jgi:hypothetical protein